MLVYVGKNQLGQKIKVERVNNINIFKIGDGPDLQSAYPVPAGMYYDAVKLPHRRDSIIICGVAGGSAGHVAREAGYKRIVGIERDQEMYNVGVEYFATGEVFDKIVIGDCLDPDNWANLAWLRPQYSAIFFDAYNGSDISSKALDDRYLSFMLEQLHKQGVIIFNCPTDIAKERVDAAFKKFDLIPTWYKYQLNHVALIKKP